MSANKVPSIREQVIQVLTDNGPLKAAEMMSFIKGSTQHSVESKLLEMMKDNLVERDTDMVYKLREGVTVKTLETGEMGNVGSPPGAATPAPSPLTPPATPPPPALPKATGMVLDQQNLFMSHLVGIGVSPKEAIPTITDIFFSGDINSLAWLHQVLQKEAAGFVKPNQMRTIISWWAHTRGLPYKDEDFPYLEAEASGGKRPADKEPLKTGAAKVLEDAGIGWKVGKDKDGDWTAMPGGTLTQEAATAAAERRATIAAMGMGAVEATSEESPAGGEGKSAAKAAKPGISFQDKLMDKVLDFFIDNKTGKGDGESEAIKALRDEVRRSNEALAAMKDQQDRDWKASMEANLAEALSRDPWGNTRNIEELRTRLGVSGSGVTDSSPAVQLIKDVTQKADKSVDRLTGLVERLVLKTDEFRPEDKRTPEEKEKKAGDILEEAQRKVHSQDVRKRTFGH
jgi:hypothetical protein